MTFHVWCKSDWLKNLYRVERQCFVAVSEIDFRSTFQVPFEVSFDIICTLVVSTKYIKVFKYMNMKLLPNLLVIYKLLECYKGLTTFVASIV